MAAFRQLSTFHICARSSRADRAMPESQPGFGLPEIPPTRLRSRNGPGRTWQRCRSGVRPDATRDRNRNAILTDPHHGDCRCGSRSCRRAHPRMCQHSSRASVDRRRVSSGIAPTIARNRLSGKTIGMVCQTKQRRRWMSSNVGPVLRTAANERCRAEMLRWPSKEKYSTKDCFSGAWI